MKNRDLTFTIKVQNAARTALKALGVDFKSAGKDASDAAGQVTNAGKAFDDLAKRAKAGADAVKSATASNVSSANQEVTAQQRVAQAYDRTAAAQARLRNSRGQFASQGSFVVGGTAGSKAATAAQDAQMAAMVGSSGVSMTPVALTAMQAEAAKLRAALYPATTEYEALMAKQKMYNSMLKAGVITQTEYNGASALVKKGLAELEAGVSKHTSAVKVNTLAMRESLVLMREFARGDTSRMAGSATLLAQSFGLLDKAMMALMNPVVLGIIGFFTAAAAALGLYTSASVSASQESVHLTNMLKLQAATSGLNVNSFKQMADSIAAYNNVSVSSARSVASTLASSGAFTSQQIQTLANDAEMLGRATGQSANDIAKDFDKMRDGAGKYAEDFAKQYNGILSPMQVAIIKDMDARGQKEQALETLITDINKGIVDNTVQSTNAIVNAWRDAVSSVSNFWEKFKQNFSNDLADQVAVLNRKIAQDQAGYEGIGGYNAVPDLIKQRDALQTQIDALNARTKAEAEATAQQRQFTDATEEWQRVVKDDPQKFTSDVQRYAEWSKQAVAALKTFDATGKLSGVLKDADSAMVERIRNLVKKHDEILKELKKKDLPGQYKADTAEEKKISPQEAIYRMGLEVQGQGFSVSENSHFGGVSPGVHHGLGHAQDRAIDVNSVAGDDASVAWARAKDTALAMESASKGFIALFNHTRYAPDGKGGFTTSAIKGGEDQHTSHVHIEAPGSMSPNGLKSMGQAQMEIANRMRDQALFQAKILSDLQAQVKEASLLPNEAKAYAEVQKVVDEAAQKGVDISSAQQKLLFQQYKALIDQRTAAEAINNLRMGNLDSEKKAYVAAQAKAGLTYEDQQAEDARNAAMLQYMSKFDTAQEAISHLNDKDLLDQLAIVDAWAHRNVQIDRAKIAVEQLAALEDEQAKRAAVRKNMGLTGYDAQRAQAVQDQAFSLAQQRHLDPRTMNDPKFAEQWKEINQLAEQYGVQLDADRQRELQLAQDLGHGLQDGLKRWADEARNLAGGISDLIGQTLNGLTDALTDFVSTGKASFGSFISSAIRGVEQLIIKFLVLKAIEAAMNFIAPGSGSMLAGLHHSGGMGGSPSQKRAVDPMVFYRAPRLHGGGMAGDAYRKMMGLKSGEVPAILKTDERVLDPKETRAYNAGRAASRITATGRSMVNQSMVFAPQVTIDMGSSGDDKGMSPQQSERASRALKDEMGKFVHDWAMKEKRPGGLLYIRGVNKG
jgi:phage-related minor tail protein